MAQRAEADTIGSDKLSLRFLDSDLHIFLAGDGVLSDETIFQDLCATGRLYKDLYELNPALSVPKLRSQKEILELFSIDPKQSVYQEFIFYCERRKYFLTYCKNLIQHIRIILDAYEKKKVLNATER